MNSDMPTIVNKRPEKEKSDHRAVDALYRISAFASSQPDPKLALEGILDEVMNVFDASSASICLLDANSDKLLIEVERGLSESAKGFELPMGVGITGWVALRGEPFLCAGVEKEEKYFELDDRVRCEMAAPLTEGDRTVGALSVDSLEKEAFQEADLRLLTLMANEASRVPGKHVDGPTVTQKSRSISNLGSSWSGYGRKAKGR